MDEDQKLKLKLLKAVHQARDAAVSEGEDFPDTYISAAPKDPEEKKVWVNCMFRIQVAVWVDEGAACVHCGHQYTSVDDLIDHHPMKGYGDDFFVCGECWKQYLSDREVKQATEALTEVEDLLRHPHPPEEVE